MTAEHIHDALTLLPADLVAETDRKRSGRPKVIVWKRYASMAACFALVLCTSLLCLHLFRPKYETAKLKAVSAETAAMQGNGSISADTALPETAAAEAAAEEAGEEPLCALPTAPARAESTAEDIPASHNTAGTTAAPELYPGITLAHAVEAIPATAANYSSTPKPKLFHSREELDTYKEKSLRLQVTDLAAACESYDESWFAQHDLLLVSLYNVPIGETPQITGIRHDENQWKFVMEGSADTTETEYREWHFLLEVEKGLIGETDSITLTYA